MLFILSSSDEAIKWGGWSNGNAKIEATCHSRCGLLKKHPIALQKPYALNIITQSFLSMRNIPVKIKYFLTKRKIIHKQLINRFQEYLQYFSHITAEINQSINNTFAFALQKTLLCINQHGSWLLQVVVMNTLQIVLWMGKNQIWQN